MDAKVQSETTPLLSSTGARLYTSFEDLLHAEASPGWARGRLVQCRSWMSMSGAGDSDAEYQNNNTRSRTLPNEASTPFVYLGLASAILAGLCFTSSNVMVKYIPDVNSWQLLFVRCISQLVTMLPVLWCGGHRILGTPDLATRGLVAAQGVLGGLLLLGIFEAVARLPLGDCTAIFFSAPAFTMVMSCFLLRDHCGVWRIVVAISLLSGVLILARPESLFSPASSTSTNTSQQLDTSGGHRDPHDGSYDAVGLMSAVSVPFLSALLAVITRQAKHVHYSVLVFWFGVGGLVVSLVGMFEIDDGLLFHEWDERMWILSFMVSLLGILGSILMTKAVCWVTPSKVMVVRSFEVVAAYILQVTVFDNPTHWSDLVGTLCVVIAVVAMGFEDCIMERVKWRWM